MTQTDNRVQITALCRTVRLLYGNNTLYVPAIGRMQVGEGHYRVSIHDEGINIWGRWDNGTPNGVFRDLIVWADGSVEGMEGDKNFKDPNGTAIVMLKCVIEQPRLS